MLELDSPRWRDLNSAYGPATKIPKHLSALEGFPPHNSYESEPYFSLWSALCHQGDVYTASYAALPHLVSAIDLAPAPQTAPWTLFLLIACIEIARASGRGPVMPEDLKSSYDFALKRIPNLVRSASVGQWDEIYCRAALAAFAAAKGFPQLAQALTELDPETITAMLKEKFGG
jgi:hypothetical protein